MSDQTLMTNRNLYLDMLEAIEMIELEGGRVGMPEEGLATSVSQIPTRHRSQVEAALRARGFQVTDEHVLRLFNIIDGPTLLVNAANG